MVWRAVFFFNDTATTEIYPLSLHDALPIYEPKARRGEQPTPPRAVLLHHGVDQDRQRAVRDVAVHRRRHSGDSFGLPRRALDRKSTRLNSSHGYTSYAVFCLTNTYDYTIHT